MNGLKGTIQDDVFTTIRLSHVNLNVDYKEQITRRSRSLLLNQWQQTNNHYTHEVVQLIHQHYKQRTLKCELLYNYLGEGLNKCYPKAMQLFVL